MEPPALPESQMGKHASTTEYSSTEDSPVPHPHQEVATEKEVEPEPEPKPKPKRRGTPYPFPEEPQGDQSPRSKHSWQLYDAMVAESHLHREGSASERRSALYGKMIKHHESAIDSSEEEAGAEADDNGGVPDWIAKRRDLYQNAQDYLCPELEAENQTSFAALPPSPPLDTKTVITAAYAEISAESATPEFHPATPAESASYVRNMGYQHVESDEGVVEEDSNGASGQVSVFEIGSESSESSDNEQGQTTRAPQVHTSSPVEATPARTPSSTSNNQANVEIGNIPKSKVPETSAEYEMNSTKVQRGDFTPLENTPRVQVRLEDWKTYPPMPNSGFQLTSDAHDPKYAHVHEETGPTMVSRSMVRELLNADGSESKGAGQTTPARSAMPGDGTSEAPKESQTAAASQIPTLDFLGVNILECSGEDDELMHCKICGKTHIEPGPPVTLATRDPCGAFLPDWFPIDRVPDRPWEFFRMMINEVKHIEDIEAGRATLEKSWDKEYHDEHPKWQAIGHPQGGWWNCRTGPEATAAERMCKKCHKQKPLADPNNPPPVYFTMEQVRNRKKSAMDWMAKHQAAYAEKVKAEALQMIRDNAEPHPSMPPRRAYTVGDLQENQSPGTAGKGKEVEIGDEPKSAERMLLEAMWNHKGPLSTLVIPTPASPTESTPPDDEGLMMRTRSREPLHSANSSLGSQPISSFLSKSPTT
ncbi:uncharacterized protein L3040_002156 [Drepanopeziza brunnea f. sp. 'multigermtubi']|uniref:uncharacterized protein n=1 Tax=Drepanopeziza brunnea f. sp. 'multigermtubi' TaxID=698441 RepID=UPI0023847673|nr:hypothetical protein L3040_002156 [Drepanopeziza brunnea f. sp. 'multigermtubi']